jgi:hypothetical protein
MQQKKGSNLEQMESSHHWDCIEETWGCSQDFQVNTPGWWETKMLMSENTMETLVNMMEKSDCNLAT